MNFKKNKGYVAVDAALAVFILVIMIPTITGMIYNINKNNKSIDRKTEAISIAVNTLEVAKGIGIEGMKAKTSDSIATDVITNLKNQLYSGLSITDGTLEKDSNTYKIAVTVEDYADTHTDATNDLVKTVKVIVTYKVGNKEENIELNTVIS